jgi:hypothetical protein
MAKDGNARHQCICGHERHEGRCGKPRYSSTDTCRCLTYVDAAGVDLEAPSMDLDCSEKDD